jgi:hypothetical protein
VVSPTAGTGRQKARAGDRSVESEHLQVSYPPAYTPTNTDIVETQRFMSKVQQLRINLGHYRRVEMSSTVNNGCITAIALPPRNVGNMVGTTETVGTQVGITVDARTGASTNGLVVL